MYDLILLAAGRPEKEFEQFNLPTKAYIEIAGKKMIEHVLEKFSNIDGIEKRILLLPEQSVPPTGELFRNCIFRDGGGTITDSLFNGLAAATARNVLIAPCDIPLISKEAIDDFLEKCMADKAQFCYSYLSRENSEKKFPKLKHTYAKLRSGVYCGGSLFLLKNSDLEQFKSIFNRITAARKNIFQMAKILGFGILIKYLIGNLTVEELEKKASEILNMEAKGIESSYPEIAFNVDSLSQLEMAQKFLTIS